MLNAFGRNYEEIGSSDKGLILKNSGKVKILWGKSFIDLLDNNGKLNVKVEKLIKLVNSDENINEDGFYFVNGILKAKSGDNILEIISDLNSSYISFLEELNLEEELKYKVLQNIGFIYKNIEDVNIYPTNGIIYNEKDTSLYIIQNGQIASKYYSEIPSIINKSITIKKSDTDSSKGALVIEGEGIENSLLFNSLQIYTSGVESNINIDRTLNIYGKNSINENLKIFLLDNTSLKVNSIESLDLKGFKIYLNLGKYWMDIDCINVKNKISIPENIIPQRVFGKENIILLIDKVINENLPATYNLVLKYKNNYPIGGKLRFYIERQLDLESESNTESNEESTDYLEVSIYPIECVISSINKNTITVESFTSTIEDFNIDSLLQEKNLLCYLISSTHKDLIIGELDDEDKYNNNYQGIISKLNIFYSAKFMKENNFSFSLNNYPFYDSALITDLENNINNLPDGILIPAKLFKALEARVSALEN